MARSATLALACLAVGLAFGARAEPAGWSPAPGVDCALSAADLEANAKLSFDAFDQKGVTRATARKLGERRCFAEAARATEHFLAHATGLTTGNIVNLTWHHAQYLASSGEEETAARVMLSARRSAEEPPQPDGFDWNSYVVGSWAFLVKDRATLDQAAEAVTKAPGIRNQMNGKVLRGLQRCFERSYDEAYNSPACAPAD